MVPGRPVASRVGVVGGWGQSRIHVKSLNFSGAMSRHSHQPVQPPADVSQIPQNPMKPTGDVIQKARTWKCLISASVSRHISMLTHCGICSYPNRQRTISRLLSMSNRALKEWSKSASAAVRRMQATHQYVQSHNLRATSGHSFLGYARVLKKLSIRYKFVMYSDSTLSLRYIYENFEENRHKCFWQNRQLWMFTSYRNLWNDLAIN